jgi:beta-phosphoglucomutase-like phosphatase (HAD superfamily)
VVTSSTRRYAAHVLKKLGIDGECRALVGGDEVSRNKPYPDAYLLGAERIGADVACCWVVEDSTPGMQAGLNAGMRVLAIPGPLVLQEFVPEGVQVIDSLAEVLPAIDGK